MSAQGETNNLVLTYGDFTADFNKLPATSLVAMLRRGFGHYMGSEAASKVTAAFADSNENKPDISREEFKAKVQAEFMAKLVAGTVGVSTRGPAIDPIQTIVRRLAKAEIVPILKTNGLAWPKNTKDESGTIVEGTITLPNGDKVTGEQLIERRIAQHGDRLNKEAKKIADDQARKAKKAEEAAAQEGLAGL